MLGQLGPSSAGVLEMPEVDLLEFGVFGREIERVELPFLSPPWFFLQFGKRMLIVFALIWDFQSVLALTLRSLHTHAPNFFFL